MWSISIGMTETIFWALEDGLVFPLGIYCLQSYKAEIAKMTRSQTSGFTIKTHIRGQFYTGKIIKDIM